MSDIDPQELEEAINAVEHIPQGRHAGILLAAARAHLATLPHYLNVEVVTWCLVDPTGRNCTTYSDEKQARCMCPTGWQVVKLTGTARALADDAIAIATLAAKETER